MINFNQDMFVPENLEEFDYSNIFEFEAVSIIDGSSVKDLTT